MNTLLSVFTNWKTSLAGIVTAVAYTWANGGLSSLHGKDLVVAIGTVALGALAKDGTKTGAPSL